MIQKILIALTTALLLFSTCICQVGIAASPGFMMQNEDVVQPVTILMYHRFSEIPEDWSHYCTSPKTLENDIIYLKKNGYEFLTASELATEYKPNSFKKVVLLTMDDGYDSDYLHVLPLLEKYQVKATIFVTGSFVGEEYYLTEEMLRKLAESPYVEIGNHSYQNHVNSYATLQNMLDTHPEQLAQDYLKNKIFLERIIRRPVTSVSYPNGLYNKHLNHMVLMQNNNITFSTDLQQFKYGEYGIVSGRINRPHEANIEDLMGIPFEDYSGQ